MEKKVIIEEIQMYADQPPFGMDDKIKELHYGKHPLARSVLGTEESVGSLAVDQMRAYFESRYAPNNMFVAAAGRVDFDALVKQLSDRCGRWKPADAPRETGRSSSQSSFHLVSRPSSAQQYLLQLSDAPSAEDDRRYAAKLLATMFGDDSGSRLYWELVDSGLTESASVGHYEYQGAGMYFTWVSCNPEDAADNFARLTSLQSVAETAGFTDEELHQAKSKVKSRVVLGSERPRNRLFNVGGNWLQRREYRSVADDLKALEQVRLADIHGVLRDFPLSKHTTVTIGPLENWID
jgi:predicted Zn-dependent peptidase